MIMALFNFGKKKEEQKTNRIKFLWRYLMVGVLQAKRKV